MGNNPANRASGTSIDHKNREKDDFYPTPPEATLGLLSVEKSDVVDFKDGIEVVDCELTPRQASMYSQALENFFSVM